jgi:signal transduction histidine kinase
MTAQRKRWPWILLFVSVMVIIAVMATSWNWVLVQNYNKMILVAKDRWTQRGELETPPWLSTIFGTLGFSALIVLFALFFAKILREMKINQLQKDFLANITHELKTPLASLELSSSLLKKGGDISPEDRDVLWQAHDAELKRLRDEIDRLLAASRWEQFHDKPDLHPVSIEAWLSEALVQWQRMLPAGATLVREGDPLEGLALVDVKLLALITSNLIDNARKFSGAKPAHITVRTRRLSGAGQAWWSLRFEDQGLGFGPNDATKLFKRFERLEHRNDHAIAGSGLGLHLALEAARAMNLELEASSDGPTKGARFTLKGRLLSAMETQA